MKNNVALFLCLPATALAQPIITTDILPQPGDAATFVRLSSGVSFVDGPAQYWDLLGLPTIPAGTTTYADPDAVNCGTNYADADVAALSFDGAYAEFYRTTGNAWTILGLCATGTDFHQDHVDLLVAMTFPWTYGDSWEDPYSYLTDGEGLTEDTLRWNAGAWGTLRLPGGLELEVVGQHFVNVMVDTAGTDIWTLQTDRLDLYAPGMPGFVARFYVDMMISPTADTTYVNTTYVLDDATLGLLARASTAAFELWPVPAQEVLNLRWPGTNGMLHIVVADAAGRVVQESSVALHANTATLQMGHLPPGAYVLRASAKDGSTVSRMITVQ